MQRSAPATPQLRVKCSATKEIRYFPLHIGENSIGHHVMNRVCVNQPKHIQPFHAMVVVGEDGYHEIYAPNEKADLLKLVNGRWKTLKQNVVYEFMPNHSFRLGEFVEVCIIPHNPMQSRQQPQDDTAVIKIEDNDERPTTKLALIE